MSRFNVDRLYPPVTMMERQMEGKPWLRRYRTRDTTADRGQRLPFHLAFHHRHGGYRRST